VAVENVYQTFI